VNTGLLLERAADADAAPVPLGSWDDGLVPVRGELTHTMLRRAARRDVAARTDDA
jgi:hypothetical protein